MPMLLPLIAAALYAGSADVADLSVINRQVAEFVAASGAGEPQPVDPRLRLVRCDSQPVTAWYGGQRATVLVSCNQPHGWRLYVPVKMPPGAAAGVSSETVITRGEEVMITASGDGFAVTRSGEAQEVGRIGQWIRVRIANASPPLRARVTGPGEVALAIH